MSKRLRGVILAGGTGTRLYPLTRVTNKHLLPVGRQPMVVHAINKMREAGITDIMIVTGREYMGDVLRLLGSGSDLRVQLTYRVQDESGGIAEALKLAEAFSQQQSIAVVLADNIFKDDLSFFASGYLDLHHGKGAMVVLKEVVEPERFGVVTLAEDGGISSVVEKPKNPESNLSLTGIYFFDNAVWGHIDRLRPSARGELEITDAVRQYMKAGTLRYMVMPGWWTDAGTHLSYRRACRLVEREEAERATRN